MNWEKLAQAQSNVQTRVKTYKKTEYFKPKEGVNNLRIAPEHPTKNPDGFVSMLMHWDIKVAQSGKFTPILCELSLKYPGCLACDVSEILIVSGHPELSQKGEKMTAEKHWVFNVVDRNDEEKGVQIWDITAETLKDNIVNVLKLDPNFTDARLGRDLILTRKGNTYTNIDYSAPTPLHRDEAIMAEWISNQPDLIRFMKNKAVSRIDLEGMLKSVPHIEDYVNF